MNKFCDEFVERFRMVGRGFISDQKVSIAQNA